MSDGLRVDLTAAHVLDGDWNPLSVLDVGSVAGDRLQIALLHLAVASPRKRSVNVEF